MYTHFFYKWDGCPQAYLKLFLLHNGAHSVYILVDKLNNWIYNQSCLLVD